MGRRLIASGGMRSTLTFQVPNFMDELIQRELNPPQQEAVRHTDGPLLILAGAGSGKTRVITYRIAYLMHMHGVLPQHILAVTFTNKAAAEMRQRLEGLLGSAAMSLWMSTFHAACVRILRREADAARLSPQFVIYDTSDQLTLLRQCMKELHIAPDVYAPQSLMRRISTLKNDLMDPDTFMQEAGDFGLDEIVSHVYPLYQRRLQDNAALDFDDLLMRTVQLMRRHPDVLERYQQRFRYILVDEYQDTNMAQYHLLNLLADRYRNLCVVGDDDQSVYRFRGANVRNILNFERDYPDAKVVKLEQNSRSRGCRHCQKCSAQGKDAVDGERARHSHRVFLRSGRGARGGSDLRKYRRSASHRGHRVPGLRHFLPHQCPVPGAGRWLAPGAAALSSGGWSAVLRSQRN
jgi:DNA helicase-2/ATP-dependent DNA helicase PcrA